MNNHKTWLVAIVVLAWSMGSLKNQILISMPHMNDPFFSRSVVYICEHGNSGAMGMIINKNLYTSNFPDPDILIRTGGRKRLSNFLLWQLAYSELYFVNKLWPDFTVSDYGKIINNFKKVKRNFGKIWIIYKKEF